MIRLRLLNDTCRFSPPIAVVLSALLSSSSDIFAEELTPVRIKAAHRQSTLL